MNNNLRARQKAVTDRWAVRWSELNNWNILTQKL